MERPDRRRGHACAVDCLSGTLWARFIAGGTKNQGSGNSQSARRLLDRYYSAAIQTIPEMGCSGQLPGLAYCLWHDEALARGFRLPGRTWNDVVFSFRSRHCINCLRDRQLSSGEDGEGEPGGGAAVRVAWRIEHRAWRMEGFNSSTKMGVCIWQSLDSKILRFGKWP